MSVVTHEGAPARVRALCAEISACRLCAAGEPPLPHAPNPVAVISSSARICVCGQAPGTRVHASGVPFTDPSGTRLREWMGISQAQFYDPARLGHRPDGVLLSRPGRARRRPAAAAHLPADLA